eukprot:363376-Chlamydomonas_euryale.AAC.1
MSACACAIGSRGFAGEGPGFKLWDDLLVGNDAPCFNDYAPSTQEPGWRESGTPASGRSGEACAVALASVFLNAGMSVGNVSWSLAGGSAVESSRWLSRGVKQMAQPWSLAGGSDIQLAVLRTPFFGQCPQNVPR